MAVITDAASVGRDELKVLDARAYGSSNVRRRWGVVVIVSLVDLWPRFAGSSLARAAASGTLQSSLLALNVPVLPEVEIVIINTSECPAPRWGRTVLARDVAAH